MLQCPILSVYDVRLAIFSFCTDCNEHCRDSQCFVLPVSRLANCMVSVVLGCQGNCLERTERNLYLWKPIVHNNNTLQCSIKVCLSIIGSVIIACLNMVTLFFLLSCFPYSCGY